MASPGRTPLTDLEKAKRLAARTYRKLIEIRNMTEDDFLGMRKGDLKMGRKQIAHSVQIERAKKEFLSALIKYRDESQKVHVDGFNLRAELRELKEYRKHEKLGRKSADKVIQIKDLIRKELDKLEKAKEQDCPLKSWSGKGRPPMSREDRIKFIEDKISQYQSEIGDLIKDAPTHLKLYYQLHDKRIEVRNLNMTISSYGDEEVPKKLTEQLDKLTAERDEIEQEMNDEMRKNGVKSIKEVQIVKEKAKKTAKRLLDAAKTLPKVTETLPNSAETLPNSTQTMPNMETLSLEDLETHLSKHLNNEDEIVQLLRNRLAANEKEDYDLAILSSILLRRYELRAEKEKLDGMIKLFIHE